LPPESLPVALAEFHRVLAPGGHALLAFQVGDERVHLERGFGHAVSLDIYRRSPDDVTDLLRAAGLVVFARLLRDADEADPAEKGPRAYLLARKPARSLSARPLD
jgi:hypothetical protein